MAYSVVSETGKLLQYGFLFTQLNQSLLDTQQRIVTGKKSQTFGGLGSTDATLSQTYRVRQSDTTAYSDVIDQLTARTNTMDQTMTDTSNQATAFIAKLKGFGRSANQTNFSGNLAQFQSEAKDLLNEITTRLNTQQNGRYLFSGDLVTTAPVSDITAASTVTNTTVSGYTAGSASTIISNINGLTDTQLGYNTNLAAAGAVKTRVEDNYDATYNIKADGSGLNEIIKGLATIANLQYNSSADSDFFAIFDNAVSRLDTGTQALNTATGKLGATRQLISNIKGQHTNTLASLETDISNTEDSDAPRDSTKLYALQNQLQAAYQITAQLSKLSLLNFL